MKGPSGAQIPLDTSAPTYDVQADNPILGPNAIRSSAYVSHFSTCPQATDHHKTAAEKRLAQIRSSSPGAFRR